MITQAEIAQAFFIVLGVIVVAAVLAYRRRR
jgi:hypothetical protein